jgi:hypothetical protein
MKIELSLDEINAILAALEQMPYNRVSKLIPGIVKQAENQIKAQKQEIAEVV